MSSIKWGIWLGDTNGAIFQDNPILTRIRVKSAAKAKTFPTTRLPCRFAYIMRGGLKHLQSRPRGARLYSFSGVITMIGMRLSEARCL